jgi:hypothetical protein
MSRSVVSTSVLRFFPSEGSCFLLLFLVFVVSHVALHRVSLLMSCLDASSVPVGVREES